MLSLPLVKAFSSWANLGNPDKGKEGHLDKRTLKKQISDVSMDSKGYPACLKSPKRPLAIEDKNPFPKGNAKPKEPPTFSRRKIGQKAACQKQEVERDEDELKEAMGIKEVGKRKKQPGAKKNACKEANGIEKETSCGIERETSCPHWPLSKGPQLFQEAMAKAKGHQCIEACAQDLHHRNL